MQNVPKIVRERLKAAPSPGSHPDADLLTAFTEQSLPEVERATVIEHLARCAACRDIVALALPATEAVETSIAPVRTRWLTWPVLRWGFVAAGIVAIASFGVVQYQHSAHSTMTASQVSPRPESTATEARSHLPAPPAAATPAEKKEDKAYISAGSASASRAKADVDQSNLIARADVTQAPIHQRRAMAGALGGAIGGPIRSGPSVAWQQHGAAQVQAPAPAPPSAFAKQQATATSKALQVPSVAETVEVTGQAVQVEAQANQKTELRNQPEEPQGQYDYYGASGVGKAKPAATTEAAAAAPSAQPVVSTTTQQQLQTPEGKLPINGRDTAGLVVLSPRWTISATGVLQRSFDQGNTWQDVNVVASAAPSANFTSLDVTAETALPKEKDARKKPLKRPAALPTFRAVAANGAEVWAGGTHGALYHSIDAGNHWTRILPASAGAILTGDIVSLEFPDSQLGKITTSTSEIWTTTDDGQTWQKQ